MFAYLLITNVPKSIWCADIDGPAKVIGRNPDSHIVVPAMHVSVSRQHAEVWSKDHAAFIKDLGSTTGTTINAVGLIPLREYEFHVGDRIMLGELELEVVSADPDDGHVLSEPEPNQISSGSSTIIASRQEALNEITPASLFESLTHAEREVVLWMARGITHPNEIGSILFRSPKTIQTQLNSVYSKLGVHSRDEVLGWLKRAALPDSLFIRNFPQKPEG